MTSRNRTGKQALCRVLFVHANNSDVGGSDFCLFKLASSLDCSRYQPVVALRLHTPVVDLYERAGIPVHILPILRIQKNRNPATLLSYGPRFLATVLRIARLIRRDGIDIVHSNDLLDFAGSLAARLTGRVAVQHVRMIVEEPNLRAALVRIVLGCNNRVLCVSEAVRREMFAGHPRASVLYDWLDLSAVGHDASGEVPLRNELELPSSSRLIACVGRLEEWKGQHVFLEAVDRIAERLPDVHFLVVGGPVVGKEPYFERLMALREASPFRDRVHFLGHRTDIAAIMREVDLVAHTSTSPDPLPGVVMEAMFSGTVVVGAAAGGVPEELEAEINGFLYPAGSARSLANQVIRAFEQHDLVAMGRTARDYVLRKFDRRLLIEQLSGFYDMGLRQSARWNRRGENDCSDGETGDDDCGAPGSADRNPVRGGWCRANVPR